MALLLVSAGQALLVSKEALLLGVGWLSAAAAKEIGPCLSHHPASYPGLVPVVTGRVQRKNANVQGFLRPSQLSHAMSSMFFGQNKSIDQPDPREGETHCTC